MTRDAPDPPDPSVRELLDEIRRLREDMRQMTGGRHAAGVPEALAAALEAPPRSRPVPVALEVHGRAVTAFITGSGRRADPAAAWDGIRSAVPEHPGHRVTGHLRAGLPAGVTAITDGRTLIASTAASRADLHAALRIARTAGLVTGSAALLALLRHATPKPSTALGAMKPAIAVAGAAGAVAIGAGIVTHMHPGAPRLVPGALGPAAVAPAAKTYQGTTVQPPGHGGSPQAHRSQPAGSKPGTRWSWPSATPTSPHPAGTQPGGRVPTGRPSPRTSVTMRVPPPTTPAPHKATPAPRKTTPAPRPSFTTPAPHRTTPAPQPSVTMPAPGPSRTVPVPHVTIPPLPRIVHHLVPPVTKIVHHLVPPGVKKLVHQVVPPVVRKLVHHIVAPLPPIVKKLIRQILPTLPPVPPLPLPTPSLPVVPSVSPTLPVPTPSVSMPLPAPSLPIPSPSL